MKFRPATAIAVMAMATAIVGCAGGNTRGLEIKPAPINEMDVRFGESFPVQVFLYVKGGLADGCTKLHAIEIKSRSNNIVKVEATVERPKDAVCPAIYTFFERNLNLGSDFRSGETYTVTVNDKSRSFKMP